MFVFGILGYALRKLSYEPAPMVLAFVLGPLLEKNLRQALILSDGNISVFLTRPLSAISLIIAAGLLLSAILPFVQKRRSEVIVEED
jgi:putative tricarboxylic transport membrane protein